MLVDLGEELRALPRKERGYLLKGATLPIEIPPEHSLAMKGNLALSWNKLRSLRRCAGQKSYMLRNSSPSHSFVQVAEGVSCVPGK